MKMLKRASAAAAALLMLTAGLFLNAHAESSETVGDYVVSIGFDQGIMIEKYNGSSAQVVIPSQMTLPSSGQTLSVFGIGDNAFDSNLAVTSVSLPDSVTYIGQGAFSGCRGIVSVAFGNSVEEIGVSAFGSCSSIVQLHLPDSLKVLGSGAFEYCDSLQTVYTGDGIETLTSGSFSRCGSLFKVTLGKNVTTIEKNAFLGSSELEEVWFNEKAKLFDKDSFDPEFCGKIFCYYYSAADEFAHDNNIEHEEYEIAGITLAGPDKTIYYEGETVSVDGLKVTARYKNAPSRGIDLNKCVINTEYEDEEGRSIEVIYTEGTKSPQGYAHISFIEDTVTGIEITKLPDKLQYFVGDSLDVSGISVKLFYDSGKTETVSGGFTCTPTELTQSGAQTVTLKYGAFEKTFVVNVSDVVITGITINTQPTKTVYFTGDSLITNGLTISVSYSNGQSVTVSQGFSCSPISFSEAGTKAVTVTYSGFATQFNVTVNEVIATSIAIKTNPTKTSYRYKESFSSDGLTLTVSYSNGTSETVSSGYECSGYNMKKRGVQTVTVIYNGSAGETCTAYVDITVSYVWWQWIMIIVFFGWIWYN